MFQTDTLLFIAPEQDLLADAGGQYARKVMVLRLAEPQYTEAESFLQKVFAAVQLDWSKDVLSVALASDQPYALTPALREKQPEICVVFGVLPPQLGLHFQISLYQPLRFADTVFLFADAVSALEPDRDKKTKLWQALKSIFANAPR